MTSLLILSSLALIALGLGRPVVLHLGRDSLSALEQNLLATLVGVLVLHLAIFAVGLVRLDATAMAGILGLAALGAWPGLTGWWRGLTLPSRPPAVQALWMATVAGLVVAALLQSQAPPADYDGLVYHLPLARHSVESGRIGVAQSLGVFNFFPMLMGNLSRLALILTGDGLAQAIHGLFALGAALAALALVRRLGGSECAGWAAAAMVLGVRAVIWEAATAEVDLALAAYAAAALPVLLAWRERGGLGLAILAGLMLGGTIATKYHGFALCIAAAPLLLEPARRRKAALPESLTAALAALAVAAPPLVRNFLLTGDPVYPLFPRLFDPALSDHLSAIAETFGTGRGVADLLAAPWTIFMLAEQAYDGAMIGTPYFLALAPLAILHRTSRPGRAALAVFAAVYFVIWFYMLSQQVRFLIPIVAIPAAFAALGGQAVWAGAGKAGRLAFAAMVSLLVLGQSSYAVAYLVIRLPPSLGLVDDERFLESGVLLSRTHYATCRWIESRLGADETMVAFTPPILYYCPATRILFDGALPEDGWWWLHRSDLPEITVERYLDGLRRANARWVLIQITTRPRAGGGCEMTGFVPMSASSRLNLLMPYLRKAAPATVDCSSAVYDLTPLLTAEASR